MTAKQQLSVCGDPAKMLLHQAESVICMRYGDSVANGSPSPVITPDSYVCTSAS